MIRRQTRSSRFLLFFFILTRIFYVYFRTYTLVFQITWIIIQLSKNPNVLKKLRLELDSIFPEGQMICTGDQLSKLHYLTKVIKEGMRLFPVIAVGSNRTVPVDIKYKNFILPKGSSAMLSRFVMDRVGIQRPDDFFPERWNDDDPDVTKLKESFVPFAVGR